MATPGSAPNAPSVLIAGGGTAGHLMPGLAVASALTERGWPAEGIHFVGSARGIDAQIVPDAGFGVTLLGGRGLTARRVNLTNARAAASLAWATVRGIALVRRRRPAAVLSLGGYAALPATVGAVIWRVPLVIAEQNAVASATNRLLGRFARAAAVPVRGTGLHREVVTGNPVRPAVVEAALGAGEARAQLGWPADATVVVVFGGSLGSLRINTATWTALASLQDRDGVFIYHVVGKRDWAERPPPPPRRPDGSRVRDWYRAVPFDEQLPVALAAADVAICRAGASTVAELSVIGTPAVLVPLPIATNDHQRRNAEELAATGAARVVADAEFDGQRMLAELEQMLELQHPLRPERPPEATFGRRDSAQRVAQLVIQHSSAVPGSVAHEDRWPRKHTT
ncbi:UDP-N-acetylglucosamine--N-acetylmuramyl-(pentapeptide) pyrophosphoryl-undecaprenol N-acetylglucosamine transferase [Candidatus Poriferisodalis sp.]|uniref:UDP-N-acetylglucosamine--N-acetylmuramyl- (pentapeptide) pyrophosphoryl-undecaprenol N-acetylglucosamine transferase n=1 Tax=Candidatus Poriferisodalis sp. TaxID=3101277 RepID=UPI003B5B2314